MGKDPKSIEIDLEKELGEINLEEEDLVEIDPEEKLVEIDLPRILYVALDPTLKIRMEKRPIHPKERINTGRTIEAIEDKCRSAKHYDINYVLVASDETRYERYLNDPDFNIQVVIAETMGLSDMKIFQMANQADAKGIPFLIYTSNPSMYGGMKDQVMGILNKPKDMDRLAITIAEYFQKT